jgi:outer membrane protein TolC
MMAPAIRAVLAAGLCFTIQPLGFAADLASIAPVPSPANAIIRPYLAPTVPPIRMGNSTRLAELIRAGRLYLTLQDAIALALENNIDIEVARYNPILAAWNLKRAQAGGALPGVPSGASQAGTVATGQGVVGSQQAAGVSGGGNNTNNNQTANATISQVGPVTQNLDPAIQQTVALGHTTRPQPNVVQSLTPSLVDVTRVYNTTVQEGFLTGGNVTIGWRGNYLDENSPSNLLNPSDASTLSLSVQHNLLRGFGVPVNARTITVSRMNIGINDTSFRAQVIDIVAQVVNAYYGLVADDEDIVARQSAYDVAQTLLKNVNEQVRIGSLASTETTRSEAQVASTRLDLVNSETTRVQQELRLKLLISRNGTGDRALDAAHIVPLDSIVVPDKDDLQPASELVERAFANRPDILNSKAGIETSEVNAIGTRNGILPTAQVLTGESLAGLAGVRRDPTIDPYFVGGMGTAIGQSFRRNFPTDRVGGFLAATLKNRQAQADYGIDQLQLRQTELSYHKALNQVEVDIMNSLVAVQQARARVLAAVESRKLAAESLRAEERKYELGASTPSNVIQQQRDLATARASEVAARSSYQAARVSLQRSSGNVLEANNVSLADARSGIVPRRSGLPDILPDKK